MDRLLVPDTQLRAYFELAAENDEPFEQFVKEHQNLRVLRCPQRGLSRPLYIISYTLSSLDDEPSSDDYQVPRPQELFFQSRAFHPSSAERLTDRVVEVFHQNGSPSEVFDADNLIQDGCLIDINGDKLIERVEADSVWVEGTSSQTTDILSIRTVEKNPRTLLRVILNWHPRDSDTFLNSYTWDLRGSAEEGWDVVLFPDAKPSDIQARFRWNAQNRKFEGPAGGVGQHFAVLPNDEAAAELELKHWASRGGLGYPVVSASDETAGRVNAPRPPPPRAYEKQSRQSLSDAELFEFMGPGRDRFSYAAEHAQRIEAPKDFWTLPPKKAALAMAEMNRSGPNAMRYQLAIDDRDGRQPPPKGRLLLRHQSSGCYDFRDWTFLISIEPGNCWLAHARSASTGAAYYDALDDSVEYFFDWRPLSDEVATHLAHTIWWLDRVRSYDRWRTHNSGFEMSFSTADGSATVTYTADNGGTSMNLEGGVYSGHQDDTLADRWRGKYNHVVATNLICHLIESELPKQWGFTGDFLHIDHFGRYDSRSADVKALAMKRRHASILSFLEKLVPLASELPPDLLQMALEAGGQDGLPIHDALDAVATQLKAPSKDEIERDQLWQRLTPSQRSDYLGDSPETHRLRELTEKLKADFSASLRRSIPLVRRQLAERNNVPTLAEWAKSKDAGAYWALGRLKELDQTEYLSGIESLILDADPKLYAKWAISIYKTITKLDPTAAVRIKDQATPELRQIFEPYAPDGKLSPQEVDALLAFVAANNNLDTKEAVNASIDRLVPPDDPMRYPTKLIDDALARKLRRPSDDWFGTADHAGIALMRRDDAIQYWVDLIAYCAQTSSWNTACVDQLCQLALKTEDRKYLTELEKITLPHLHSTTHSLRPWLISIYNLNLRNTDKRLRQIATKDGIDVESDSAYVYGGQERNINGRYHLPRQILAVWDEPDPTTRTKLRVAWIAHDYVTSDDSLLLKNLMTEIRQSITDGSADRGKVSEFIEWCLAAIHQDGHNLVKESCRSTLRTLLPR